MFEKVKTGFVPGSFKPFTKGHYWLIQQASKECDKLYIIVSTLDRIGKEKDEITIKGNSMVKIWSKYLLQIMPQNAEILFVDKSPMKIVYDMLSSEEEIEKENKNINNHTKIYEFIIYGADENVKNAFNYKILRKIAPTLLENWKITIKIFPRLYNISGTNMRKYLFNNKKNDFIFNLPEPIRKYGNEIWSILKENE